MGEVYELSKKLFSGGNWGALDRHISFFLSFFERMNQTLG